MGADWHRFHALLQAAGGKLEALELLVAPSGGKRGPRGGRPRGGSVGASRGKQRCPQSHFPHISTLVYRYSIPVLG